MLSNGPIALDHAPASWGFTNEHWHDGSYCWLHDGTVYASFLWAYVPGRGAFSRLVAAIRADGYDVAVPSPSTQMRAILMRWGWVGGAELFGPMHGLTHGDLCEVWRKPKDVLP